MELYTGMQMNSNIDWCLFGFEVYVTSLLSTIVVLGADDTMTRQQDAMDQVLTWMQTSSVDESKTKLDKTLFAI